MVSIASVSSSSLVVIHCCGASKWFHLSEFQSHMRSDSLSNGLMKSATAADH